MGDTLDERARIIVPWTSRRLLTKCHTTFNIWVEWQTDEYMYTIPDHWNMLNERNHILDTQEVGDEINWGLFQLLYPTIIAQKLGQGAFDNLR